MENYSSQLTDLNITDSENHELDSLEFVVEGILIPMLTCLGLVGNILAITVLHSPGVDMKVTFRQVLTMLSLFDSVFISSAFVSFSLPTLSNTWKSCIHPYIFPWTLPLIQISLNGSIWSTVSVTLERYITVVHPRHILSRFSSRMYIVPVVLSTALWNIPRFLELETCSESRTELGVNRTLTTVCPTDLRLSISYTRDYILISNFTVMTLIPFILLSVFNYLLFKTIRQSGRVNQKTSHRQKRDQKIAAILILLVTVFACCNFVRIVTNVYEVSLLLIYGSAMLNYWPVWCQVLTLLSHLLLVFNSSVNIAIYCWKDEKFRKVLLQLLRLKRNNRRHPIVGRDGSNIDERESHSLSERTEKARQI